MRFAALLHASFEMLGKQLGTGSIPRLRACDFQQTSYQGDHGFRRQVCKPFTPTVRHHHATFPAGNLYETRPMVPEHDVRALTSNLCPCRCAARHRVMLRSSQTSLWIKGARATRVPSVCRLRRTCVSSGRRFHEAVQHGDAAATRSPAIPPLTARQLRGSWFLARRVGNRAFRRIAATHSQFRCLSPNIISIATPAPRLSSRRSTSVSRGQVMLDRSSRNSHSR